MGEGVQEFRSSGVAGVAGVMDTGWKPVLHRFQDSRASLRAIQRAISVDPEWTGDGVIVA
jgi:hypothetical protein